MRKQKIYPAFKHGGATKDAKLAKKTAELKAKKGEGGKEAAPAPEFENAPEVGTREYTALVDHIKSGDADVKQQGNEWIVSLKGSNISYKLPGNPLGGQWNPEGGAGGDTSVKPDQSLDVKKEENLWEKWQEDWDHDVEQIANGRKVVSKEEWDKLASKLGKQGAKGKKELKKYISYDDVVKQWDKEEIEWQKQQKLEKAAKEAAEREEWQQGLIDIGNEMLSPEAQERNKQFEENEKMYKAIDESRRERGLESNPTIRREMFTAAPDGGIDPAATSGENIEGQIQKELMQQTLGGGKGGPWDIKAPTDYASMMENTTGRDPYVDSLRPHKWEDFKKGLHSVWDKTTSPFADLAGYIKEKGMDAGSEAIQALKQMGIDHEEYANENYGEQGSLMRRAHDQFSSHSNAELAEQLMALFSANPAAHDQRAQQYHNEAAKSETEYQSLLGEEEKEFQGRLSGVLSGIDKEKANLASLTGEYGDFAKREFDNLTSDSYANIQDVVNNLRHVGPSGRREFQNKIDEFSEKYYEIANLGSRLEAQKEAILKDERIPDNLKEVIIAQMERGTMAKIEALKDEEGNLNYEKLRTLLPETKPGTEGIGGPQKLLEKIRETTLKESGEKGKNGIYGVTEDRVKEVANAIIRNTLTNPTEKTLIYLEGLSDPSLAGNKTAEEILNKIQKGQKLDTIDDKKAYELLNKTMFENIRNEAVNQQAHWLENKGNVTNVTSNSYTTFQEANQPMDTDAKRDLDSILSKAIQNKEAFAAAMKRGYFTAPMPDKSYEAVYGGTSGPQTDYSKVEADGILNKTKGRAIGIRRVNAMLGCEMITVGGQPQGDVGAKFIKYYSENLQKKQLDGSRFAKFDIDQKNGDLKDIKIHSGFLVSGNDLIAWAQQQYPKDWQNKLNDMLGKTGGGAYFYETDKTNYGKVATKIDGNRMYSFKVAAPLDVTMGAYNEYQGKYDGWRIGHKYKNVGIQK